MIPNLIIFGIVASYFVVARQLLQIIVDSGRWPGPQLFRVFQPTLTTKMPDGIIGGIELQTEFGQLEGAMGAFVATKDGAEHVVGDDKVGCIINATDGGRFGRRTVVLWNGGDIGKDNGKVVDGKRCHCGC